MGHPDRRIADLIMDLSPMNESSDLPDLFAVLARSVVRCLGADACLVSICDEGGGRLRDVAASVEPPAEINTLVEEYDLDDFPATREILEKQSFLEISVNDSDADLHERAMLESIGFERVLLCAFSIEDEVVGTIEAYRSEDRPFRTDDPEQVDLMVAFANNHYSRIQLAAKLESHYTETMEALTSALEARDPSTEAHTGRISNLSLALAVALKTTPEVRKATHLGAILHDVGKIGISDTILQKPGPLTDEEWEVMRLHPEIGERMLRRVDFLRPALPVIRHHHERWDGGGYPDGLKSDAIPLAARIVAVCDAYDAMTSDRPYREALAVDVACGELLNNAETQFDPTCARVLVTVLAEMGEEDLEEKFVRFAT